MRHLISITSSCMSWTIPARQCSCRDWSRPLRLEQSANHDSNDIFSTQDRNENSKVLLVNSEVVLIYYSGISWRVTTLAYGTSEVHEKKKKKKHYCGSVSEVALSYQGLTALLPWHKTLTNTQPSSQPVYAWATEFRTNTVVSETPQPLPCMDGRTVKIFID